MSLYAYKESQEIASRGFDALIMAAMRKADTDNAGLLREAFPEIWKELLGRYNAPGGLLPGEINT